MITYEIFLTDFSTLITTDNLRESLKQLQQMFDCKVKAVFKLTRLDDSKNIRHYQVELISRSIIEMMIGESVQ